MYQFWNTIQVLPIKYSELQNKRRILEDYLFHTRNWDYMSFITFLGNMTSRRCHGPMTPTFFWKHNDCMQGSNSSTFRQRGNAHEDIFMKVSIMHGNNEISVTIKRTPHTHTHYLTHTYTHTYENICSLGIKYTQIYQSVIWFSNAPSIPRLTRNQREHVFMLVKSMGHCSWFQLQYSVNSGADGKMQCFQWHRWSCTQQPTDGYNGN